MSISTETKNCFNYLRLGYILGRHEAITGKEASNEMFASLYSQIDEENPSMDDIRTACNEADEETLDNNVFFKDGYLVGREEAYSDVVLNSTQLEDVHKEMVRTNRSLTALRKACDIVYSENEEDEDIDSIVDDAHFLTGYKVGVVEALTREESLAKEIIDTYHKTLEDEDLTIEELRKCLDEVDNDTTNHCCCGECCHCHDDEDCEDDNNDDLFYLSALPKIDHILFSGKATIIFWADGKKSVVKCQKGDRYSQEEGLAMGICKRAYGNDNTFNDVINDAMKTAKVVDGKKSDKK